MSDYEGSTPGRNIETLRRRVMAELGDASVSEAVRTKVSRALDDYENGRDGSMEAPARPAAPAPAVRPHAPTERRPFAG